MDDALLRELNYLGVDETTLSVLALLPLAQVAWADGEVQNAEREKILEMADQLLLPPDSRLLLDGWLQHAPSESYVERGRRAMLLLAQNDSSLTLDEEVLHDVVGFAQAVAKAAGGFMGFGAVTTDEARILEEIAEALHVRDVRIPKEWLDPDDESIDDEATDVRSPEEMAKIREAAHIATPQRQARTLVGDAVADLVHHGADGGINFPMDAEGLRIGRSRTNEVQIPHDHGLSRLHARIEVDGEGRIFVVDNETTNGTFVNGERILKRRLFGGEQIRVGESHFTFMAR